MTADIALLLLVVFLAIMGHLAYWNWMPFAMDYTLAFVLDSVLGWAVAGAAIAAVVKPSSSPDADAG